MVKTVLRILAILLGVAIAARAAWPFGVAISLRMAFPVVLAASCVMLFGRRPAEQLINLLNDRSPVRRRLTAVVLLLLSAGYFVGSAIACQRAFHPVWHDDQMHAVQTAMLAEGYLWHTPHALPEFFDTFHIFMTPVYAPLHFPGTAILNVAGVWLGFNYSAIPLLMMSLTVMLAYLIVSELIDGVSGLAAALCVCGSSSIRMLATMQTSHNAMVFLGMLLLWIFLQWRKRPTWAWSAVLGLTMALAGFTRPVDALAYALPLGVGVLIELYRQRPRLAWARVAVMIAAGLPLVGLQLAFDKAVTGKYFYLPYAAYNDRFFPTVNYGESAARKAQTRPAKTSDLPQKQMYYEDFMLGLAKAYDASTWKQILWDLRVPRMIEGTLPGPIMAVVLPLGLFGLFNLKRRVVVATAFAMFALYVPHVFFFLHYPPVVIGGMVTLALLGVNEVVRLLQPRWENATAFVWTAVFVAITISQTPFSLIGVNGEFSTQSRVVTNFTYEKLPYQVKKPALVFCRITNPDFNYHDEPVYNSGTGWPDDAKIVLAQFLGPHNADLVRYYHNLGQNRHVYELDRDTLLLRYYGTVDSMVQAEQLRNQPATAPATRP